MKKTCFYCKKEFTLEEGVPASILKKVKVGEEVVGICCPKCEFEKIFKNARL